MWSEIALWVECVTLNAFIALVWAVLQTTNRIDEMKISRKYIHNKEKMGGGEFLSEKKFLSTIHTIQHSERILLLYNFTLSLISSFIIHNKITHIGIVRCAMYNVYGPHIMFGILYINDYSWYFCILYHAISWLLIVDGSRHFVFCILHLIV